MSCVSATDGGSLVGDEVPWTLGSLAGQDTGVREFTVQAGGGVGDGEVLLTQARITDSVSGAESRAQDIVLVETAAVPVELLVTANPDPVQDNAPLEFVVAVTNPTGSDVLDAQLEVVVPDHMGVNWEGTNSGSGAVPGAAWCSGYSASYDLAPGLTMGWSLGTLSPGETRLIRFYDRQISTGADEGDRSTALACLT